MANLVKVKDVYLYTTTAAGEYTTANCSAARELLTSANIEFTELWYNDPKIDERAPCLAALSTWNWGPAGTKGQRRFTEFPILHWTECYDDWTTHQEHAHGFDGIRDAIIIKEGVVVGLVAPTIPVLIPTPPDVITTPQGSQKLAPSMRPRPSPKTRR